MGGGGTCGFGLTTLQPAAGFGLDLGGRGGPLVPLVVFLGLGGTDEGARWLRICLGCRAGVVGRRLFPAGGGKVGARGSAPVGFREKKMAGLTGNRGGLGGSCGVGRGGVSYWPAGGQEGGLSGTWLGGGREGVLDLMMGRGPELRLPWEA